MTEKKTSKVLNKMGYSSAVSIPLIVAAILLSFVDLIFLNDVIGKVLDVGATESAIFAFALGLVGIGIMAHQGVKEAHGEEKIFFTAAHYALWISLGITFAMIRLFSALILQLDGTATDEAIINIAGLNVRQIDLIFAPLMFLLYLTTGIMMKDGIKNLLLNPEFENGWAAWKEARKLKKIEEGKRRRDAEEQRVKDRDKAEQKKQEQEDKNNKNRINNALNGNYSNALVQFRAKEREIKEKYQKISANMDYVKSIDKQEKEFEVKVKPSLLSIVQASIHSVQNNVALAMRKKTGEESANLRGAIESHNNARNE